MLSLFIAKVLLPAVILVRTQEFVEQAKQEECWRPLADEEAPIPSIRSE